MEHVSSKHCQYHTLEVLENYIRVVVKGEEMLGVDLNGVDQKVLDISSTGRGCDPLGNSACWQIAVVVDSGSPTRSDLESSISVTLNSGRVLSPSPLTMPLSTNAWRASPLCIPVIAL